MEIQHLFAEYLAAHVQQLGDDWIAQPVVHGAVGTAALDDAAGPEDTELLRGSRGLNIELPKEVTDTDLTVTQELDDVDTQRVAESLEELRLEPVQWLSHALGQHNGVAVFASFRIHQNCKGSPGPMPIGYGG